MINRFFLIFRALGLGLGIAALCMTGLVIMLQPVIIAEPNWMIRAGELFLVGLGIVSLLAETGRRLRS